MSWFNRVFEDYFDDRQLPSNNMNWDESEVQHVEEPIGDPPQEAGREMNEPLPSDDNRIDPPPEVSNS